MAVAELRSTMKYPKRSQYKHAKQKKYYVRNWAEYNEGLRRRGAVWFDRVGYAVMINSDDAPSIMKIGKLVRNFQTRKLEPRETPEASEITAEHRTMEGFYYPINSRQQVVFFSSGPGCSEALVRRGQAAAQLAPQRGSSRLYPCVRIPVCRRKDRRDRTIPRRRSSRWSGRSRRHDGVETSISSAGLRSACYRHPIGAGDRDVSDLLLDLGRAALAKEDRAGADDPCPRLAFTCRCIGRRLCGRVRRWHGRSLRETGRADRLLDHDHAVHDRVCAIRAFGVITSIRERRTAMNRVNYWHSTVSSFTHLVVALYMRGSASSA